MSTIMTVVVFFKLRTLCGTGIQRGDAKAMAVFAVLELLAGIVVNQTVTGTEKH